MANSGIELEDIQEIHDEAKKIDIKINFYKIKFMTNKETNVR